MKNIARKIIVVLSLFAVGCGAAQSEEETAEDKKAKKEVEEVKVVSATAILAPVARNVATGLVQFIEENGKVKVSAEFHGLFPGKYTFHINEADKCSKQSDQQSPDGGMPVRQEELEPLKRVVANLGALEPDEKRTAISDFIAENLAFSGYNNPIDKTVIVCAGEEPMQVGANADDCQQVACGVVRSD